MFNIFRRYSKSTEPRYRIRYLRLFEYLYEEGDYRVVIGVEEGSGNPLGNILIDRSFVVRWDPPHEDELISEAKQAEILERLLAYLRKPPLFGSSTTTYGVIPKPHWEEKERQAAIKAREDKAKAKG